MADSFDYKIFNPEVFGKYVETFKDLNRNELIKSGAFKVDNSYRSMLPDQVGGNFIRVPIKAPISGDEVNYDGGTNITASSRATISQGMVVYGRAKGWTEKDFSADITGVSNAFLPIAGEVAHYWDNVDQKNLLAILKGIFSMTGTANLKFVNNHTYNISNEATYNVMTATTLNSAIQKACGDNKGIFSVAIVHSTVATNLENLNCIERLKYTDANGIQRDLALGTWNGRLLLIDDNMPASEGYFDATSSTAGALKVVADTAEPSTGEIKLSSVTPYFGSKTLAANDYVLKDTQYISYILGEGAFIYCDVGAKVPYEMDRNAATNGGQTTLYSRIRKLIAPKGISFVATSWGTSPSTTVLETGSSWAIATDNESTHATFYPHKAIPICRILTRG